MSHLAKVDPQFLRQIAESGQSRRVKREYIKKGYNRQLSLYGVLTDKETGLSEYRRIEVLSNVDYNERLVALLYDFYNKLKTPEVYTIWIYDKDRKSVKEVGSYV